jgi:hypothetical protein
MRITGAALLAIFSALGATGCLQGSAGDGEPSDEVTQTASALTVFDVTGFESKAGWSVSSGTVTSTATRSEGAAALAVTAPQNYTTLVSAKLASTAPALAALTNAGSSVALDLEIPTSQPNPYYLGAVQLYVSCPSRSVYNQYLGQTELTGKALGMFQTYTFAVPDAVRAQLLGATYSDLTFTIALNAPAGAKGTYLFDNLRTKSPATESIGAGPSIDLVATLNRSPAQNTPGTAAFAGGTIQIPAGFHVSRGSAGTGSARLDLGFGATTSISCTYKASSDKTAYLFSSCTGGPTAAGDIVPSGSATLTIVSSDANAVFTKIKAQLAYNALGDRLGTKLLPPIPTFWGETSAEINAIATAFFQSEVNAPPTEERFVTLPVPDFARRHGDGSPVDGLGGPPPDPNDPAFNKSGHMNPGGWMDAYWQLQGSISPAQAGQNFTSHFDASASAHAVVAGNDISILNVTTTIDTDSGHTTPSGFTNPSSHGTLGVFVFGNQVANDQADQTTGFHFNPSVSRTIDAPPLQFWIFSITVGLTASAGIETTGSLAVNGFQITATPSATFGAHIEGGVDILIAAGGVNVSVQLLDVQIPMVVSSLFDISTNPAVCGGVLNYEANAQVTIASGGGSVDLVARIGICPFCDHESVNLFGWGPLASKTYTLFDLAKSNQLFSLPGGTCNTGLTVKVEAPTPNDTLFAGVPTPVLASAERPPSANQTGTGPGFEVATPVDCQFLTWTSSDPNAVFSPSATGCSPTVAFSDGVAGTQQTLTATAADAFNEAGSATVTVNVAEQTTPIPIITFPLNQTPPLVIVGNGTGGLPVTLQGVVYGGMGTTFVQWSEVGRDAAGNFTFTTLATSTIEAGTAVPVSLSWFFADGPHEVILLVNDSTDAIADTSTTFGVAAVH